MSDCKLYFYWLLGTCTLVHKRCYHLFILLRTAFLLLVLYIYVCNVALVRTNLHFTSAAWNSFILATCNEWEYIYIYKKTRITSLRCSWLIPVFSRIFFVIMIQVLNFQSLEHYSRRQLYSLFLGCKFSCIKSAVGSVAGTVGVRVPAK
jgi:hypothetical protein